MTHFMGLSREKVNESFEMNRIFESEFEPIPGKILSDTVCGRL